LGDAVVAQGYVATAPLKVPTRAPSKVRLIRTAEAEAVAETVYFTVLPDVGEVIDTTIGFVHKFIAKGV
jgi:hypothetical protein